MQSAEIKPDDKDIKKLLAEVELLVADSKQDVYIKSLKEIAARFSENKMSPTEIAHELTLLKLRMEMLKYKRLDTFPNNTALHQAIIENDMNKALLLIEADKKYMPLDGKTIVPVASSENTGEVRSNNTALMFAIKKGMVSVAMALLDHPAGKEVVATKDGRGLTPLHWACVLRQDELIKKLIACGAPVVGAQAETRGWWGFGSENLPPITPLDVYKAEAPYQIFSEYWFCHRVLNNPDNRESLKDQINATFPKAEILKDENERYSAAKNLSKFMISNLNTVEAKTVPLFNLADFELYPILRPFVSKIAVNKGAGTTGQFEYDVHSLFADCKNMCIAGAPAYTDLVFFMGDVCINLFGMLPSELGRKTKSIPNKEQTLFAEFLKGAKFFCQHRNAIAVNPEIAALLSGKKLVAENKTDTSLVDTVFKPKSESDVSNDSKKLHSKKGSNM